MNKSPIKNILNLAEPLILTNDKTRFIHHGRHPESVKFSPQLYLPLIPSTVIDEESLNLIQVLELHSAIDRTKSATGSALLLRSLVQPITDLTYILSKQEALDEIAADNKLRQALTDCVQEFTRGENALYKFFNKGLRASFPYSDIKKARQSSVNLARSIQAIPRAESVYLNALLSNLHSYKGTSVDQMMQGTMAMTFTGLKSEKEMGFFTPRRRFRPQRFTEWLLAGPALALTPYLNKTLGLGPPLSPWVPTMGLAWTGAYVFYGLFIKPVNDTEKFIEPFRKKCISDMGFNRMIDGIGMMDELLSCHCFAKDFPHQAILPRVTDQPHHFFDAEGLTSPVLAKQNKNFVPSTVKLNGVRLTFLTGPNSGGKTTVCKTIAHNQLLAQSGSYVLAQRAVINIADKIRYQAPKFDGLQDAEGRFGTELARTRDIFYSTSPKSLVILDELAEGTTYEERLKESFGILSDFYTIGNNTVLVTHNHSLVDQFMDEQKGQCLMAEFKQEAPTYKIIPGISRVSHADKTAQRINFSKNDRRRYIKQKGYK